MLGCLGLMAGRLREHIVGGPAAPYEIISQCSSLSRSSPGEPFPGLPKRAHIGRPQGALARHADGVRLGDLARPCACKVPLAQVVPPMEVQLLFHRGAMTGHWAFFADCHGRDRQAGMRFSDRP